MGVIRSSLTFIAGTICGIYLAQNYNVPNVRKIVHGALFTAKKVEEQYRKPPGDGGVS